MAKKVIANPDEEAKAGVKKKKRSKCCTCLIVFAIVSIVLIAAIIGVGWYFGDKYTQQFFGMSLGETFDVLGDLYWTDDEDVVKRKYQNNDVNDFYDELKKNVLLKDDASIDFEHAIFAALDKYLGTNMAKSDGADVDDGDGEQEGESASALSADGNAGGDALVDMLVDMIAGVFTKENIDVERLKEYDDETNDTYVFELKDKSVAALVNIVLDSMLKNAGSIDFLSGANDYVPLAKVVKLKQVRFTVQAKTDEQGVKTQAAAAQMTVWLGMQDAAGYAVKTLLNDVGFGWAGGFAAWLCDVILPENVYVNVTVPLEDGAEPIASFNTMNAQERKQMYKLVDGVFKNIMNSDMTVEGLLNDFVGKMKPFLKKAADAMDFTDAGKGKIKVDLIGKLAKTISENSKELKKDPLTKSEIMYMLQALLTTSPEKWMHDHEPYLYREWYVDANGENAVYRYDSSVNVSGKTRVDYGRMFIDELEEVYSLDFGEDVEMSDVLEMLGISFDESASVHFDTDALLEKIDKAKLEASLDPNKPIRELRVSDRMLAAALEGEMTSMLSGEDSKFKDMTIDLDAMTFVKDDKYAGHTFALLAVEIGIDKLFDSLGDNKIIGLVKGLLPDTILMSIKVDITLNRKEGEDYAPAQFVLNDYDRTDGIIDTIKKFMPEFDLEDMTKQMETMLRKAVDGLERTLDIELVTSDLTAIPTVSGELTMPDIYTIVVNTMLTEDGKVVVTNTQLKSVLYGLNNTDYYDKKYENGANIDSSAQGFIDDVIDMYYLDPPEDEDSKITDFDSLESFLTSGSDSDFGSKFRVKGIDPTVKYLAYDTRTISEITPRMTARQLGAIIEKEKAKMNGLSDVSVVDVGLTKQSITVTMSVDMSSLVPERVQALMSVGTIYFTVTADISRVVDNAYPVEFSVNSMTNSDVGNLLKILEHLGGEFDIESKTGEFGKLLYEQIDSLKTSLGNPDLLRFTDEGIELASFYEFLSSKLDIVKDDSDETDEQWAQRIKDAVQGMYEYPKDPITGEYIDEMYADVDDPSKIKNYRMDDFVFNPPEPDYELTINPTEFIKTGGKWFDKQFNSWFQAVLVNNNVIALQTIALAEGDDEREISSNIRTWTNAKMENAPVTSEDDHIIVSFMIPTGKMDSSGGNADTAQKFLPDYICATIALDKEEVDGKSQFVCVGTVVNNMSLEEYDLLMRLMGLNASGDLTDPNKVNLASITNDYINQLNYLLDFGTLTIEATDAETEGSGVGMIEVKPKIVIPV